MKYKIPQIGLKHIDWVGLILGTDLPQIAKCLAMYLSRYMTHEKTCAWPSLNRMATELSMSKSTICTYLNLLEKEQWLTRDRGNFEKTTEYTICFPDAIKKQVLSLSDGSTVERQGSAGDVLGSTGGGQEKPKRQSGSNTRVVPITDTINNILINKNNINTKFQKPTLQEITQYCRERKNQIDSEQFFYHYETNGWKVGKNPMKSWKAAIRTWEINQRNYSFSSANNNQLELQAI